MRKACVEESIEDRNIKTMVNTKCVEIKDKYIVVNKDGKNNEIACDYVVLSVGSQPNDYDKIKSYFEGENIPYYVIGDAKKPRKALDAIAEAADIARRI